MRTFLIDKHGRPVEQIIGRPITNVIRNLIHGKQKVCAACWERSRAAEAVGASQAIQVGNVLIYRDKAHIRHRYYEVLGVYLGSVDEESLVELRSLGEKPGHDGETQRPSTFVPECLVWQMEIVQGIENLIS